MEEGEVRALAAAAIKEVSPSNWKSILLRTAKPFKIACRIDSSVSIVFPEPRYH
jgi:hypothetical protein